MKHEIFNNLFVLEVANNHWGEYNRAEELVKSYANVVRFNNVKAAIKFQFRDLENFINKNFYNSNDIRYINKIKQSTLGTDFFFKIIDLVKNQGCIPMATPFDEKSVDLCDALELPIIKIASSDVTDWPLVERIAILNKPTIISTGGVTEKDLDDLVSFFEKRKIPLAINHCISIYPSEDEDLMLNQIDYLVKKYPNNEIGFSTHEYSDWHSSMLISYAKGARTWERHVDIENPEKGVSKYCSLPHQIDEWFSAFKKAQEMCQGPNDSRRNIPKAEREYLDALVRGVCAKRDIESGYVFSKESFLEDFELKIPLIKGQLSSKEIMNGIELVKSIKKGEELMINSVKSPYSNDDKLKTKILERGYQRKDS
tara:strand:- start:12083 stop:13189 length:1107 start_codon:yes stop_codon:yes gene_type:complete